MRVWRVCRRAHRGLDGEGARRWGGRWSRPGTPVVYASSDAALAALELFVHLDPSDAPADLVLVPVDVPDDLAVLRLSPARLPRGWRRYPAPPALAALGSDWAASGKTAVLRVPSVLVPVGYNVLINPLHPQARRIRGGGPLRFGFDPRMWKGAGR